MNENSGCSVTCWRMISAQTRGSSISSGATPAHWSVVMLRTTLPLVCMPCMPTLARSAIASGSSSSLIQWILDVLPRGEMAVAAIVFARDMGQHAQLRRRQRAVGNGDAQHVGVQLQIDAIHQPQRLEFFLGQFAGQAARDLIAKFRDALGDQRAVECVIDVHARTSRVRLRCRTYRQIDRRAAEADRARADCRARTWPSGESLTGAT